MAKPRSLAIALSTERKHGPRRQLAGKRLELARGLLSVHDDECVVNQDGHRARERQRESDRQSAQGRHGKTVRASAGARWRWCDGRVLAKRYRVEVRAVAHVGIMAYQRRVVAIRRRRLPDPEAPSGSSGA